MVRKINRDVLSLSQKSNPATIEDLQTAVDLEDTLRANADRCVGMAANMIGVNRRIIVVSVLGTIITMINPEIIKHSGEYTTEEGCLSLEGVRPAKRYNNITVRYDDKNFKPHTDTFSNYIAQIIQHEIDHCNGIII